MTANRDSLSDRPSTPWPWCACGQLAANRAEVARLRELLALRAQDGMGPVQRGAWDDLKAERDRLRVALEPFTDPHRTFKAKDYIAACERAREALNGGEDRG